MKNILIVCDHSKIDAPLRRSLAHLVKSCRVEVVPNGYQAFNELQTSAFDLVIIDSEITGIDGLELAESIEYIDPGVPVIFMLKQAHKALWGPARQVSANPIYRPFKPLTFLRLIDTLLHQQLERYRDLSDTLQSILQKFCAQTEASEVFLIEDSGQILVSTEEIENPIVSSLGYLAASQIVTKGLLGEQSNQEGTLLATNHTEADHELYLTPVLENLYLVMLSPVMIPQTPAEKTWAQLDTSAQEVRHTFYEYTQEVPDEIEAAHGTTDKKNSTNIQAASEQIHILIPLKLGTQITPIPQEQAQEDEVAVNWQFISNTSTVLNRLHDFCQAG